MNNRVDTGVKGVWNGWYWRFVGAIVIVLAVLEIVVYEWLHYQFIQSGELGMFIIAIMIVQRVKTRKTANTLVAVLLAWILNLVFQLTIGKSDALHYGWGNFIQQNAIIGLIGVLFCVVYARTTVWSDARRKQADAKRREKQLATGKDKDDDVPEKRVHRVKKKQGRGRRN